MTNPQTGTPLVPVDSEAERILLGSIMISPAIIEDVAGSVNPDDFYVNKNKIIYTTLIEMFSAGSPINQSTVTFKLQEKQIAGQDALNLVGGAGYLTEVIMGVSSGEYEFWAEAVKKKAQERKLLEFAEKARRLALSNPEDVSKARSELEEELISLSGKSKLSTVSIENSVDELEARLERYINDPDSIIGLPTGWRKFDRAIDGLQRGNVTIVYAPSSRFKSLWVTNVGLNLASQGIPGLWFTTEMPRVQVMERLLQLEAEVNLRWARRDRRIYDYKARLYEAKEELKKYPIFFNDSSAVNVDELRQEVSRYKRWQDIEYVVVDLVDHVSSSQFRDEMVNNQRKVMSSIKAIAKEYDVHMIVVSHVVKGDKDLRGAASLDVENMQGSSAKYQDVDTAISIMPVAYNAADAHWVGMQREEILNTVAARGWLDVMVAITKNRHGELLNYLMKLDFHKGGKFEPSVNEQSREENKYYQYQSRVLTEIEEE